MEILSYTFFQHALAGLLLVSIASAIIGTYVVSRRMVFITGGITHASFGGLGLGFYAGLNPVVAAGAFAVAAAMGVEWLTRSGHVREDSAIGVVWALGMALGTIFIFVTPGYVPELTSFLFGNVLTIDTPDLIVFALYLVVLVACMALFFRPIVACAFDSDFARTQGLPVAAVNLLMTVLVSVCVVLTIRLIGIMLLMSLLTLPPITAELWARRLLPIMGWAVVVSVAGAVLGLAVGCWVGAPVSATIVVVLIATYAVARCLKWAGNKMHRRDVNKMISS